MAVLTRQGLSPARANHALDLQGRVAQTHVVDKIQAALADAYAGAWFEPATAKLHVGVTSDVSRHVAASIAADLGLTANVVQTSVRSTRAALLATQKRWDKKLAKLFAPHEYMTGLDSRRNAVVVKLSSSAPAQQRAALESTAARADVNVLITVVPASQLLIEPENTECEFVKGVQGPLKERAAWCEISITSGVQIEGREIEPKVRELCTVGPLLIKGTRTFALTAGHCVAKLKEAWESEWPVAEPPARPHLEAKRKLGIVTAFKDDNTLDSAEIEVELPGEFSRSLPTPVPAYMAEWGNWRGWTNNPPEGEPITPVATAPGLDFESHTVSGEVQALKGYADCHEGRSSGEQCGEVELEEVDIPGFAEHLVEDSACAEHGDSGGPYFYYAPKTFKIYMEGTLVGGLVGACNKEGKPVARLKTYFEPMKKLLEFYKGQRLLTVANQIRRPRLNRAGVSLVKKAYTSSSGAITIETIAGTKFSCTADSGKGEASAESSGTAKLTLTGCEASGEKCHTSGAAEGEVVLGANYELFFTNGAEDEVGLLLKVTETTIECGKNCLGKPVETLKLRGTGVGAATPIDKEVAPPKKFTTTFSQAKGIQKPTEYETEEGTKAKAILELEGSGAKVFKFEQAGVADTDEILFEETAEIEP